MSRDAALAFLKKATEDAELQKRLVEFARDQGYDFAVDELTDAELGAVAGGGGIYIKLEDFSASPLKLDTSLKYHKLAGP